MAVLTIKYTKVIINTKMALYIRDSGGTKKDMAMEFKHGQMVPSMKVIGKKIKHVGKVPSSMLTVTYIKVSGEMIKPMVMGHIIIRMVQSMKVDGKMIFKKAMELRHGKTAQFTKVTTKKDKNMELVSTFGQMVLFIRETGLTIR